MGKSATITFAVGIPNSETRAALAELKAGGGKKFEAGTSKVFRRIVDKRKKPAKT